MVSGLIGKCRRVKQAWCRGCGREALSARGVVGEKGIGTERKHLTPEDLLLRLKGFVSDWRRNVSSQTGGSRKNLVSIESLSEKSLNRH